MKFRNICFVCLWLALYAFAASPRVAEYCAEIVDDSTYRPLLIKDLDEPIKDWIYPDSIPCEHTPCRARWETESKVFFPYDIECRDDGSLVGLLGGGGGGLAFCTHCPKRPIKLQRIEKIKLYGSKDMNGCCRSWQKDEFSRRTFHLRNARETLKTFYGMTFWGKWSGEWETNGNADLPPMERDFPAKLVGECNDTIPAVEYCVSGGKNVELHLVDYYDVLPRLFFNDGNSENDDEENEDANKMICEGAMRVEKTYEMDFGKYGKRTLAHFVEQDTCHLTNIIATEVYMPIPKFISADVLKGIPAKSLYGKRIPISSKNILNCNFDTVERNAQFYARIGGKCGKLDLQKKEKMNIFEFEQIEGIRHHTENMVHWISCGEGFLCPLSGIEVKDMLP